MSELESLYRTEFSRLEGSYKELAREKEIEKVVFNRDNDVALEVDSQLLLVMDRAAVRSYAGKALHYDAEECEFCWIHLDK